MGLLKVRALDTEPPEAPAQLLFEFRHRARGPTLSLPIGTGTGVDCLLNIGIFIDKLGGSIDELLMS